MESLPEDNQSTEEFVPQEVPREEAPRSVVVELPDPRRRHIAMSADGNWTEVKWPWGVFE